MALYHLINTLTNDAGDKLVGYYVRLRGTTSGEIATIYANAAELPIADVSGVANAAKTDETGLYSIYVEDGSYDIEFYDKSDANLLLRAIPDVPMFGFNSASDALAASGSATEAAARATTALAAQNMIVAALLNGDAFTDTTVAAAITAGLATVAEGEYFIATGDDIDEVRQYQDVAGVAELIFAVPKSDALDDAVAAATAAAGALPGTIGFTSAAASVTLGATTPNTTNASANVWSNGIALAADSIVTAVGVRLTNTATLDFLAVNPLTRTVLAKATGFAVASGDQSVANPFGASTIIKRGAIIFVRRASGTGVLRSVSGGAALNVADADYALGADLPAFTKSTSALAISVTASAVSDAVAPRLDALEVGDTPRNLAVLADTPIVRSYTIGSTARTVAGNTSALNMPALLVSSNAVLTSVGLGISGAGQGAISVWEPSGSSYVLKRRLPVTLADGVNNVTIPRWFVRAGSAIIYESVLGNNLTYASGGSYYKMASAGQQDIGETGTIELTANFSINLSATLELPIESSYRADYASINGPTRVSFSRFRSTTTPNGWSIASPFAVSSGLGATGAGGWSSVATYQPNGSGWSSLAHRKLAGLVTITDTASVVGICSQTRTTVSGDGGAVAMIDGTANKLILYHWNGTGTAGTNKAEAAISALTAGRSYLLVLQKNAFAVSAILTDTVTGTATTVSFTADAAGDPRVHGRPGVMHLSGTVNWEWIDFTHDTPRNVKAVVIGDSNGEGTNQSQPSWIAQLNTTYGNVVNACRAGETSTDMAARLTDLTDLRPELAIMAMGTNDSISNTWRANVRVFIDAAEMMGAEPILVIPPPYVAKQAFITQCSADITSGLFGRYRYIDLLGALSNANDRLTWNSTYDSGDGLHMNAAGQTRALQQALFNVPELAW